ncbi:MAG TPA: hypothetical protein VKQ08_04930, partial [Cyclobacteriaceae bacterium]|nr:hypothetical protein [Cyclobacteriaceae bacterium]
MMSKRAWILFGAWLGIFPIHAATYTSPTAAYSDVAATITAASAGDTVLIPAGSATWSSTLTISKSIYLIGAGTNASGTHISGSVNFISISLPADAPVRVSGIWFTMGSGSASCIYLRCKCSSYRIDHCWFDHSNPVGYGYGARCIYPAQGRLSGCIDHNTFVNWNIAISPQDDESTDGSGNPGNDSNYAWTRPYVPGTTNVCCIEDNVFRMDANSDAVDINEQIYHFDAPRTIIRYNVFDSTGSSTPAPDIDAHGNQSFWGGCQFCVGNLTDTSNDRST